MNTIAIKNTKVLLLIVIASVISLIPIVYFTFGFSKKNAQNIIQNGTTSPIATNRVSAKEGQAGPGLPLRLVIPSLKVDADVTYVGLASDGSIDTPKGPYDVAWFKLGPRPGQNGSAVITGHYGQWRSGAHSVFDNLLKLKKGDVVYVKDDKGATISFTVREIRTYKPNETVQEIFNKNDGAYLNLITCNGDWIPNQKTFTKRLVVFTKAVK